jgi:hypothetical protein
MWKALLTLALLAPALAPGQAPTAIPEPTACKRDDTVCREGCTLEFGTTQRTRMKLGQCLEKCRTTLAKCSARWAELHRSGSPQATTEATPPPAEAVQGVTEQRPPSSGRPLSLDALDSPRPSGTSASLEPELEEPAPEVEAQPEVDEYGIRMPTEEQLRNVPWEKPAQKKPKRKKGAAAAESP